MLRRLPYTIVLEACRTRSIDCSTNFMCSFTGTEVGSAGSDLICLLNLSTVWKGDPSHGAIFAGIFAWINPGSILHCSASK